MKHFLRTQLDRYFGHFARRNEIENLRQQVACIAELQLAIPLPMPLGKLGGWALSADALVYVVRDIRKHRPPLVIEFGCGVSTIVLAALLKTLDGGLLISIEHDLEYLKLVKDELASYDLTSFVEQRHMPLVSFTPSSPLASCQSYDLRGLDLDFDVAVVDGPITSKFGAATRLAPLEWCAVRLHPGATVYLDDADRAEERQVVEALLARQLDIKAENLVAEKGLVRLTRHALTAA